MTTKASKTKNSPPLPLRDNRWYGRRADLPDPRDVLFRVEHAALTLDVSALPDSMDLRPRMRPKLFDQLALGACVGNAVSDAYAFVQQYQTHRKPYIPSRLFVYYGARAIEGSVDSDAGCEIRDAIKVVSKLGAPHETLWPYRVARFASKPTMKSYTDGLLHQAIRYARVDNAHDSTELRQALVGGFPVIIGITVFESFESTTATNTGVIPMPKPEENVLGGHCMLAVGYETDDHRDVRFIVRNSWGASWGDGGYCYIPEEYLIDPDMASDFWVLSGVER
jgi:C1A family cysteine protease